MCMFDSAVLLGRMASLHLSDRSSVSILLPSTQGCPGAVDVADPSSLESPDKPCGILYQGDLHQESACHSPLTALPGQGIPQRETEEDSGDSIHPEPKGGGGLHAANRRQGIRGLVGLGNLGERNEARGGNARRSDLCVFVTVTAVAPSGGE